MNQIPRFKYIILEIEKETNLESLNITSKRQQTPKILLSNNGEVRDGRI